MKSSDFNSYEEYYEAYSKLERELFVELYPEYFPKGWGLGRGLEIPMAWMPEVSKCIGRIIEYKPDIEFIQIKEKFNGLRVYYKGYDEHIERIVLESEREIKKLDESE